MRLTILLSFALSTCLCFTSYSQDKIETDRPDQTESPYTVPNKYFQFEFGMNLEKDSKGGVKTTSFVHPTGLLKYGVNENCELRIEFQSLTSQQQLNNIKTSTSSLQPVEVGFKAKLWEEKGAIPKTSFILHTALPFLASKNFRHLSIAPSYRFTMQNTLSDKWALGYNLGMEWDGESTKPTYAYTIAPGFEINDKWAGYFELFGFVSEENNPEHSFDGGIYYFPNNNVKLDVSAGVGLTKAAPDFYVAVGCSFRFR